MDGIVDTATGYYDEAACDLEEFRSLISQVISPASVPYAAEIKKNVPIYETPRVLPLLNDPDNRPKVLSEWAQVLRSGPGVIAIRGAYSDKAVLDQATAIYEEIIAAEKQAAKAGADHFAASGANDRIWNSLQKLCEADPEVFVRYFANVPIAAACEAWLGPNYQMTAQVNLVHPGGAAQQAHRDYHLGFQTADISARYPAHVHDLSPALTLQGAIAHCDMPVDSGPTKLLPFSQAYRPGYAAWRRDDFRELFEERCVQIALGKGDVVFFNPALFHAAGANTTKDIHRMANLLQVSSAFGCAMENIDRLAMCKLVYPHIVRAKAENALSAGEISAAIAATAEGYSFPTNLDRDPPTNGLAPETQNAYLHRALAENTEATQVFQDLDEMKARQSA
ncbi:phytanoyl-CoA dioxygenase [Ruegeria sp. ANG-S4]|uniref:phytanoyl-CoA dioxygenase family protein n=1 Tax=Ruegeria sp. ANG-S4 TaxID=1577904 RepID=UPI0005805540|nr:phytanoyl-CoA dioxygenase family protein [Ruegeria sp. ANG-S4]KIC41674.1 phytanoyl-CoA dioxygenase [Ruegeria sp. ANG-S4]